jgi:nitrite reductase (NO-forming)
MKNKKTIKIVMMTIAIFAIGLVVTSCGGSSDKKESSSKPESIAVSLHDSPTGAMGIDPSEIKVKSGSEVTFAVTNDGTVVHNLTVDGKESTTDLAPYAAANLDAGKITKEVTVYCSIPGHREAGMEAKVVVE